MDGAAAKLGGHEDVEPGRDSDELAVNVDLEEDADADADAVRAIIDLNLSWMLSAALRVILELNVPNILATHAAASPSQCAMTAHEILQHVQPAPARPSAINLERFLRLLTCKAVFTEHIDRLDHGDARVIRRFALTPMSAPLALHYPRGTLRNRLVMNNLGPEYAAALQFLSSSVVNSEEPFAKAHGMNQFDYMRTHPEFLTQFKSAFEDSTPQFAKTMLSKYRGFAGVHTLVDVGGSSGMYLSFIVRKYPHIRGINFDLPEVVAQNPTFPGVEHVRGDMFESVPTGGDAIFMKRILHDWGDERCVQILRNCYAALPSGGKLIIVDMILPRETPSHLDRTFQMDFLMLLHCADGRERSKEELEGLVKQAGFASFQVVGDVGFGYYAMEAFK